MSRFVLVSEVRSELDEIWNYVGIARSSPNAARHLIERVFDACSVLAKQPLLGEQRDDLGPGVRAFVVQPYVILYRTRGDGVEIVQVVHSARDIHAIARTR